VNVLAVDIGGTNVKILLTGATASRRFPSGLALTPAEMVRNVQELASDWEYEAVSLGYPGPIANGRIVGEPKNVAPGWVGFDFEQEFGLPVRLMNDAAMQALGSYQGGRMLFVGLGTGLGAALVVDGVVVPMELAHLPYRKSTYEYYLGNAGRKRLGNKKWRRHVAFVVERMASALQLDEVVIGGGNVKKLDGLPPRSRAGSNDLAFLGGFRMWEQKGAVPWTPGG
jgi:predicted NBD/HSP70 family sugar kinase